MSKLKEYSGTHSSGKDWTVVFEHWGGHDPVGYRVEIEGFGSYTGPWRSDVSQQSANWLVEDFYNDWVFTNRHTHE